MISDIEIEYLDHVAIRVADMETSAKWYEKVLGLKRYKLTEWGEYPIFLLSGKTGIALFPANTNYTLLEGTSKNVKIDHFAFNVTKKNFEKAKTHYIALCQNAELPDPDNPTTGLRGCPEYMRWEVK